MSASRITSAVFAATLAFAWHSAQAATILKEEPHVGMLKQDETVYVDNGKCPMGMVQAVTGGNSGRSGNGVVGRKRQCVARP